MTWLTALAVWAGVDFLLYVVERGTGFRVRLTVAPLNEWRVLGWNWSAVKNRRNDESDTRLYQNVVEDQGVSLQPGPFIFTVTRVKLLTEGHGPDVTSTEERERLMNKERKRTKGGLV